MYDQWIQLEMNYMKEKQEQNEFVHIDAEVFQVRKAFVQPTDNSMHAQQLQSIQNNIYSLQWMMELFEGQIKISTTNIY